MAVDKKREEAQTFYLFPRLPRELRDAVWRECLPHRVAEIDIPLGLVSLGVWLPGRDADVWDEDGRTVHGDQEGRGCYMEQTTRINSAPPVITRVCRESRMVAFETGRLLRHDPGRHGMQLRRRVGGQRRRRGGGPDIDPFVDQHWLDPARDVVHLHYPKYLEPGMGVRVEGNPLALLYQRKSLYGVPASLTYGSIYDRHIHLGWLGSMEMLEDLQEISVCLKTVCIHIGEGPAIHSGLFGALGEERVVLVDALDHERISKYRALWETHRVTRDPLTEDFFTNYENDDSAIVTAEKNRPRVTVRDAIIDVQAGWVLNRWRQYGMRTPGLYSEDVWYKDPAKSATVASGRPSFPNLDHPWVKKVYSQMPKFRPTIMFRLCTHACMELLGEST